MLSSPSSPGAFTNPAAPTDAGFACRLQLMRQSKVMTASNRTAASNDWPHEQIHSCALEHIRAHTAKESEWRFTVLDALGPRLSRIVQLNAAERVIVTCFVDAQRWCVMTSARVFGIFQGSRFDCSPLDVRQWRWGDFKHSGRSEAESATLALANGTHIEIPYETGPAAMGPIYYERFWTAQYPVLNTPPGRPG